MMHLHLLDNPVDRIEGEVAAAFFFRDTRPLTGPAALLDWRLNGQLTELLLRGALSGRVGEHLLVRSNGKISADWALFIGGDRRLGIGENEFRELLHHLLTTCCRAGCSRLALGLELPPGMTPGGLQKLARKALDEMPPGELVCLLTIADDTASLV